MKIIRSKYLPPTHRHIAINLFGIMFVHPDIKVTKRLINHESIHTAQMLELCIVFFYIIYLLEWVVRLFMKGNAYMNISFEREAYSNEDKENYIKQRRHFAWIKYMKKNKKKTRKRKRRFKKYIKNG